MNTYETIAKLWEDFRDAIDAAYKAAPYNGAPTALYDYQRRATVDKLEKLLQTETANERQHRRSSEAPKGFSARNASMLLLCSAAAFGAKKTEIPSATIFLLSRKTTAEAQVIGWLCREHLSSEWIAAVESLDYAKLMEVQA